MFAKQKYTGLWHVLAWLLLLVLIGLFISRQEEQSGMLKIWQEPEAWLFFLFYILLFYFHWLILIPYLYGKKRYLVYGLSLLLLLAATLSIQPFERFIAAKNAMHAPQGKPMPFLNDRPPPPGPSRLGQHERGPAKSPRVDIVSLFLLIIVLLAGLALRVRRDLEETEKKRLRAEADRVSAELSFLKTQIHPHFLFNTLNTLYALALEKNDQAPTAILKLSELMRFILEEAKEDLVPLESEVNCISDYIYLQSLRLADPSQVSLQVDILEPGSKVPPLLLLTFVENAFKYGVSARENSPIEILIHYANKILTFSCRNRIFRNRSAALTGSTGTGLANARERLQQLYGDLHSLKLDQSNDTFTVELIVTQK